MILNYANYSKQKRFETDIVVVGTGAGGAAAGATLAKAGFRVTFVEEGGWHPPSSFNPYTAESIPRLYREASATMMLGRPPIPYIEGRCVGGSTVINGGMTWRAPEEVLSNWENQTGSSKLGVKGMTPFFEEVEKIIHAKPHIEAAKGDDNRLMMKGAKKMGWDVMLNHRNQDLCVGANNCIFGCPTGAKQSSLTSYMPIAMEHGAHCLTEVRVEKLIVKNGKAVGVRGHACNPKTRRFDIKIEVRAKKVVVAAGAIHTPYLLLSNRRMRRNRAVGRHFLCHPNVKVVAIFPFKVRSWQGLSQWSQIREFHKEGVFFAENFIPPGALAAQIPVHGAKSLELMKQFNNMIISGVLVEDSTTGRVIRNPLGGPIVRYNLTDYDHQRFKIGVRRLATMYFELGASKVMLPFHNFHQATSIDDLKKIEETQTSLKTLAPFTVHLMGSARMGSDPKSSAVNLQGELWNLPNCYVADASLFPTAIGVNPQVTIMALASQIAQNIAQNSFS